VLFSNKLSHDNVFVLGFTVIPVLETVLVTLNPEFLSVNKRLNELFVLLPRIETEEEILD
jgi:hypothetical protein